MEKDNPVRDAVVYFALMVVGLFGFMFLSWFLNKPYRTNSAIAAIAVVSLSTLLIAAAPLLGNQLIVMVNWLAVVFYVIGGLLLLNLLVFSIWGQTPYTPRLSAWSVALAAIFAASHIIRGKAHQYVLAQEGNSSARETVPV